MRGVLSEEICKADRLLEFETVAERFRVIEVNKFPPKSFKEEASTLAKAF